LPIRSHHHTIITRYGYTQESHHRLTLDLSTINGLKDTSDISHDCIIFYSSL